MPKALDIKGQRFGRLVAVCRAKVPGARNVMWECQCDCGGMTIAAAANLGRSNRSCGCLQSESATASLRINRLLIKGLHGKSGTPEWRVWSKMKDRCYNPNAPKYHRYGGRGIKVCDRWLESFPNFLEDMGQRPSKRRSIDRIDNDGDYCKENCQWATAKGQARNTSTNRWIEIDGIKLCYTDWCKTLGIPLWKAREMVRKRYKAPAQFPTLEAALHFLYHKRQHSNGSTAELLK